MSTTWIYKNKPFTEDLIEDNIGFVYKIYNPHTQKYYIGKKQFFFQKTKITTLKLKNGTKKKKKSKVNVLSDYESYYGSNDALLKDIEEYGKEGVIREILHLCKRKGENSYYETKEIFINDALLREDYYNTWISVKVRKDHII